MEKFEIWIEGWCANEGVFKADRLNRKNETTLWEGDDFKSACENALRSLGWDLLYYNKERNTYFGCRFFDNEADARKSFG